MCNWVAKVGSNFIPCQCKLSFSGVVINLSFQCYSYSKFNLRKHIHIYVKIDGTTEKNISFSRVFTYMFTDKRPMTGDMDYVWISLSRKSYQLILIFEIIIIKLIFTVHMVCRRHVESKTFVLQGNILIINLPLNSLKWIYHYLHMIMKAIRT